MMSNGKQFNDPAVSGDTNVFRNDGHNLFVLVRKDFAKPADAACQRKHGSEEADRQACDQARKYQGEAESQNKRPRSRRRHFNLAWSPGDFRSSARLSAKLPFFFLRLHSTPQNVNHGENHHPHGINKMPVHREHIHAARLLRPHASGQSENRDNRKHDQARGDVKGVQADQRVVGRAE